MKHSICSLAQVIRSKNAGPYELVLDILFKTREDYQRVKACEQLTPQLIANVGDNDVYGAQQHAPLLSIEFDL